EVGLDAWMDGADLAKRLPEILPIYKYVSEKMQSPGLRNRLLNTIQAQLPSPTPEGLVLATGGRTYPLGSDIAKVQSVCVAQLMLSNQAGVVSVGPGRDRIVHLGVLGTRNDIETFCAQNLPLLSQYIQLI